MANMFKKQFDTRKAAESAREKTEKPADRNVRRPARRSGIGPTRTPLSVK